MTLTVEGLPMTDKLSTLADCAYRIRRYALRMGEVQGQGYIGQALGMAEILAVASCFRTGTTRLRSTQR
jgi:transketolase